MKLKKEKIFSILLVVLVVFGIIFIKPITDEEVLRGPPLRYVPLSPEEVQKATSTILSTEFIQDVPEKDPIAIIFYSFENGERVQRDGFLIGNNQLLTQGEPSAYILIHAKYISEFDGNNLCEIIQKASKSGDLSLESEYGNARLLIKYSSMLKYRDCFGF